MGYDHGESFWTKWNFHLVQKLSPRSYPIHSERKWKYSFLSVYIYLLIQFDTKGLHFIRHRTLRGQKILCAGDLGRFWREFKSRELNNFPGIPGIYYILSNFLKICVFALYLWICVAVNKVLITLKAFRRCYQSLLSLQIRRKCFGDSLVQFSRKTQAPVKVKN